VDLTCSAFDFEEFHNEGYNYLSWRLEHNGVSSNQRRSNFGNSKIDGIVKRWNG